MYGVIVPALEQEVYKRGHVHGQQHRQLAPVRAAEVAEGPEHHGAELGVVGEVLQQRAAAREQAAQRHARQHQRSRAEVAPQAGYGDYDHRGGAAAHEGAERDYIRVVYLHGVGSAGGRHAPAEHDYAHRRAEGRALADAQRRGAGEGVIQHALHDRARHTQRRAHEYGRDSPGQTVFKERHVREAVPAAEQRGDYLPGRELYGAGARGDDHGHEQQRNRYKQREQLFPL